MSYEIDLIFSLSDLANIDENEIIERLKEKC